MRKILTLLGGVMLLVAQLYAQNRTVTGTVTDEKGQPLANVSVVLKPSGGGTVTDDKGKYTISVPAGARNIQFSSVNYTDVTVSLGNKTTVDAKLTAEDKTLAEVVVVGYGTQKRKDVTSSISTIGGESIRNIPVQSFDQALSGKAAGVNVTMPNGVLNNPPVIRIRGANSITGSTFPLIVIDGVPTYSGDFSTNLSANNALGSINPADIEDIQILKDASAAAIYGSRAANGVMLITTKKGKQGKAKVQYDVSFGTTKPFNLFDVLNAQQYVEMKNEAVRNLNQVVVSGVAAGAPLFFLDTLNGIPVNTNWADHVYQTGNQQNHSLSVSGANQFTKYYFSANWTKQEGMIQTNTFDRKQMRMNIEHKVNDWFKVGGNFNFSRGTTYSPNSGSLPGTPFSTAGSARLAFVTAPNVSPYTATGEYNIMGLNNAAQRNSFNQIGRNRNLDRSGFLNPVMVRDLNIISSQIDQLQGNVFAEIKPLKNLTFRTQYGVNYQLVDDRTFYNALHGDGIQTVATTDDGTAFNAFGKYNIINYQNTLNYDFKVNDKHNFSVLVGSEEQRTTSDRWSAKRSGLSDNFFNEFQGNFTINDNPNANALTENYLLSFFGRLNYSYNNKYFLSANVRRDGYSAFSEGKKWGTFAGASAGWNISNENFWKGGITKVFNSLKLRGSYGQVGNISSVGNFASLSTFGAGQYGLGYPTLFFSQAGNADLRWESSRKTDIGLDFSVLNNRITAEITYYNVDLSDLIIDVPTPPSMGIPGNTIAANAAQSYNRGFEFNINAKAIQKENFGWSINLNLTTQQNKITALASGVSEIVGTTQLERTNITKVGYSQGSFFVVRTNGVDAATGRRIFVNAAGQEVLFDFSQAPANRWKFRDGSNAPAIDLARDGYIAGNALPTAYGGFTNNFYYKDFDLTVDAFYSFGNKVYFGSRAGMLDQRFWNNTTEVLTRWQKPGDVTSIPRVVYNDNISNGSAFPIDANLYNGNFVKVRSIMIGYTLPKKLMDKAKIGSVRVYGQLLNPFVITNYPGVDPEVSVNGNSALTPGVDRNTVGQARSVTFGLNVSF
jgi:TonB-linked SusC/RagA family outer membrane protein